MSLQLLPELKLLRLMRRNGLPPRTLLTRDSPLTDLLPQNATLGTTCNRRCAWWLSLQCNRPALVPISVTTLRVPLAGNTSRHMCVTSRLGDICILEMSTSIFRTRCVQSMKTLLNLPRSTCLTPLRCAPLTPPLPTKEACHTVIVYSFTPTQNRPTKCKKLPPSSARDMPRSRSPSNAARYRYSNEEGREYIPDHIDSKGEHELVDGSIIEDKDRE